MNNNVPPCKDCKDRFVGCHSVCAYYKMWKMESDRIRDLKNIETNMATEYIQIKKHSYRK